MATPTASAYPQWEFDLLGSLGAAPTLTNLEFFNLWASSEGVAATANNPLAITDPTNQFPHSGVVASNGGDPVYAFPTAAIGGQALASFLKSGYPGVVSAVKAGNSLSAMWQAVNQSGWCRGCQGGKYPVAVYQAIGGNAPATIFGGGATGQGAQQAPQGQSSIGCNNSPGGRNLGIVNVAIGTRCQLKALTGGLLIGLGGFVTLVGAVLIASYGLGHTSAGRAIGGAPQSVPGVARAAGRASGAPRRRRQARADTHVEQVAIRQRSDGTDKASHAAREANREATRTGTSARNAATRGSAPRPTGPRSSSKLKTPVDTTAGGRYEAF